MPIVQSAKKRRRRRPKKSKDATNGSITDVNALTLNNKITDCRKTNFDLSNTKGDETEQKQSKEVATEANLPSEKDRQSSESCDISSPEDSVSKNNNSSNFHSINDDFALFTIGGSCPELFELQNQKIPSTNENLDLFDFKNADNKKSPSPSNLLFCPDSVEKSRTLTTSAQRNQRFSYRNRYYKPPNRAFIQMATFNPDYNTTSSSIVSNTNKDGFVQDCFEGLNVRFNNFDDCEELTLSDTEDVTPPRLRQFPWILDKNLRQYTTLNGPERVCCSLM